jgi:type 1 fimbria pilin
MSMRNRMHALRLGVLCAAMIGGLWQSAASACALLDTWGASTPLDFGVIRVSKKHEVGALLASAPITLPMGQITNDACADSKIGIIYVTPEGSHFVEDNINEFSAVYETEREGIGFRIRNLVTTRSPPQGVWHADAILHRSPVFELIRTKGNIEAGPIKLGPYAAGVIQSNTGERHAFLPITVAGGRIEKYGCTFTDQRKDIDFGQIAVSDLKANRSRDVPISISLECDGPTDLEISIESKTIYDAENGLLNVQKRVRGEQGVVIELQWNTPSGIIPVKLRHTNSGEFDPLPQYNGDIPLDLLARVKQKPGAALTGGKFTAVAHFVLSYQ